MKKIIILTEASSTIGLGHLNRCLNLISTFKDSTEFSFKFYVRGLINKLNINYDFELFEWANEEIVKNVVSGADLVIVDSYQADNSLLNIISKSSIRSLFIVDSMMKYGSGGDNTFVLFSSAYGYDSGFPESIKVFAGIDYLLFKDELLSATVSSEINKEISKIVISIGGYFDALIMNRILSTIDKVYIGKDISILGNPIGDKNIVNSMLNNISMKFLDSNEYVSEIQDADIVITNGGQSLNEVLFLNKNSVVLLTADNQISNIEYWDNKNVIKFVGDIRTDESFLILENVLKDLDSFKNRNDFLPLDKIKFNRDAKKKLLAKIFKTDGQ